MGSKRDRARDYMKYAGVGFEFTGTVGLFFYIGFLIDEHWSCEPWGFLAGGAIGLIGGIYLLVKEGNKMMRDLDSRNDERDNE